MNQYKRTLKIAVVFLFILQFFFNPLFCSQKEEPSNQTPEQTTDATAQTNFIYKPNNVIEISGGRQIASLNYNEVPVDQYISYLNTVNEDPSFRMFDCALLNKTASIIVHGNILEQWINAREGFVIYSEKGAIKPPLAQPTDTKKPKAIDSEFNQKYNNYQFSKKNYLLDKWVIYTIHNSSYFLLFPTTANPETVKEFFVLDDNNICSKIEKAQEITDLVEQNQNQSAQNDEYPIKAIFQPNSTGWIFFHNGHTEQADINSPLRNSSSYNNYNNLGICYDRITFLGTGIKTVANFDTTMYAQKEHAYAIANHLSAYAKNNNFTPYSYGIYSISQVPSNDTTPTILAKKFNIFFTELNNFATAFPQPTSTNPQDIIPYVRDCSLRGIALNASFFLENKLYLKTCNAKQFTAIAFGAPAPTPPPVPAEKKPASIPAKKTKKK